ncbi:MAG: hypothetical protein LBR26_11005 [Prevotella sp.]|jgi:hypothetical protein|nr:hypothetical protein [Prevotella sp.]
MNVEFEKEYLRDLYEFEKTSDKKHRVQPQVVNGYVKCVKALQKVIRMEDLRTIIVPNPGYKAPSRAASPGQG